MDIEKYLQSGKLEQYVLGLSSSEERKQVEQLAKEFPEIDAYICDLHGCMDSCSESNKVPVSKVSNHQSKCKTSYLNSKTNLVVEPKSDSTFQKTNYISWSRGIASILVVGLSTFSFFLYQNQEAAQNEIALLTTQLHHFEKDNESLYKENEKIVQQYAVLKDVNTRHINLQGSEHAPLAHGVVYWNKDHSKTYLSICNLPKTPQGHQYQVWANINGKHQKVGVLDLSNTDDLYSLSFIKECKGFCVTLEKEGTNSNPSVDKMFVKGEM